MKYKLLALIIPTLLTTNVANSAEMYNKDGNKLDVYGQIDVRHHIAKSRSGEDGDDSRVRLGLKVTHKSPTNSLALGVLNGKLKLTNQNQLKKIAIV